MRLGEVYRAMSISTHYAERLERGNLRESYDEATDPLTQLVSGYPAHECVIDRDEAAKLFKNVRFPTADETKLTAVLWPFIEEGLSGEDAAQCLVVTPATVRKGRRTIGGANEHTNSHMPETTPATKPPGNPASEGGEPAKGSPSAGNGTHSPTNARTNGQAPRRRVRK